MIPFFLRTFHLSLKIDEKNNFKKTFWKIFLFQLQFNLFIISFFYGIIYFTFHFLTILFFHKKSQLLEIIFLFSRNFNLTHEIQFRKYFLVDFKNFDFSNTKLILFFHFCFSFICGVFLDNFSSKKVLIFKLFHQIFSHLYFLIWINFKNDFDYSYFPTLISLFFLSFFSHLYFQIVFLTISVIFTNNLNWLKHLFSP